MDAKEIVSWISLILLRWEVWEGSLDEYMDFLSACDIPITVQRVFYEVEKAYHD